MKWEVEPRILAESEFPADVRDPVGWPSVGSWGAGSRPREAENRTNTGGPGSVPGADPGMACNPPSAQPDGRRDIGLCCRPGPRIRRVPDGPGRRPGLHGAAQESGTGVPVALSHPVSVGVSRLWVWAEASLGRCFADILPLGSVLTEGNIHARIF